MPSLPGFARAVAYARKCLTEGSEEHQRLMNLPIGSSTRFDLSDGLFSLEEAYQTKADADVKWEAHRDHADLQVVIRGEERMEVIELAKLTLDEDHAPARDLQFYGPCDGGSRLRIGAGEAAVYFPVDAHRPGLRLGEPAIVRKVVVKIPLVRAMD